MIRTRRILAIVPAFNEAGNLPAVVGELRRVRPDIHALVVDDGSTDRTVALLKRMGVEWLHWPERRGVGSAIRAGLCYADRLGFDIVVRLDADGQHDVSAITRLLQPLYDGTADVVIGSRFARGAGHGVPGPIQRSLGALLSVMTRRAITDPTSGFWAMGPHAVELLAEHHPNGYPEPELHLFLTRNGLRTTEVPVRARPRLSGRSSLTFGRICSAAARVLLAVIIVPLRATVGPARD
jgi:glycosyltransferase involved in cell wall biosynthesis